jgi:hypothetical protein
MLTLTPALRRLFCATILFGCLPAPDARAASVQLAPGPNVNMVAGSSLLDGDPFLQRQNEPFIAVASRNPLHPMAGANDDRSVAGSPYTSIAVEPGNQIISVHSRLGARMGPSEILAPLGAGQALFVKISAEFFCIHETHSPNTGVRRLSSEGKSSPTAF